MLTLPTSVQSYLEPARKAACDKAMTQRVAPGTLTASQCREFYAAKILGETAGLDFWCYLYDLWSATWGLGLKTLSEIPIGDKIWEGEDYDPAKALEDGRLLVAHRLTKTDGLFTGVLLDPKSGPQLMFSVWRPKGKTFENVTSGYELGAPWRLLLDETTPVDVECYWTQPGLVRMVKNAIPIEPLQAFAKTALTALAAGPTEKARTVAAKKAALRVPKVRSRPLKPRGRKKRS